MINFRSRSNTLTAVFAAIVLFVSYFTLFRKYEEPAFFFWDENYHVAAAQKYLNGVFFMEPHPPLGKLLIAAGEYLLAANRQNNQFLHVDHAPVTPDDFSFRGYRFFPVLLATFCPLLLFLALRLFSGNIVAGFVALLFALDNALIVHLRGAMLEGIQLFFALIFILGLSYLCSWLRSGEPLPDRKLTWLAVTLGVSLACVLTTKLNGIVLVLLLLPFLVALFLRKSLWWFVFNFCVSFAVVFITVWCVHINLGRRINPKLPNSGFYQASPSYKSFLEGREQEPALLLELQDHFRFVAHYTHGVPELNYCKKEENGSPWYWWLVGGKGINYRWEKKDNLTHFLYLTSNPVGWALSLAGVLFAAVLSFSALLFRSVASRFTNMSAGSLLFVWLAYLAIFGSLGRVMYLYHYFIPLILGWIMFALFAPEIRSFAGFQIKSSLKFGLLALALAAEAGAFAFFSPLTYANGISNEELKARAWLDVWDIRCVGCETVNPLAKPIGDPKKSYTTELTISGLRALESYQEWGDPKMDRSVTGETLIVNGKEYSSGLGVHAESRIIFALNKRYKTFTFKAGLPDYLRRKTGGSVVFRILGDGREIWKSALVSAGTKPIDGKVDISAVGNLALEVKDGGDGNTDDHALWLEPKFD